MRRWVIILNAMQVLYSEFQVIFRDIHRTFPAHEFFKEAGGSGQEALFRISKAYR